MKVNRSVQGFCILKAASGVQLANAWNDWFCLSKLQRVLTGKLVRARICPIVICQTNYSVFVMACHFSPKEENYSNRYKRFRELRREDSLFSELSATVDLVRLTPNGNVREYLTTWERLVELIFTPIAPLPGQQTLNTQRIYTHLKTPVSEKKVFSRENPGFSFYVTEHTVVAQSARWIPLPVGTWESSWSLLTTVYITLWL